MTINSDSRGESVQLSVQSKVVGSLKKVLQSTRNNYISASSNVTSNVSHNNMVTQANLLQSTLITSRVQVPETLKRSSHAKFPLWDFIYQL